MHVSFAVIARRIGICYQRQRGTNSDTNETNDRWRNKTRQRKDMGRAEKEEVEKWPWLDRAAWQSHASWEVCCFSVIADIFGFIEWRYPWHCIRYYCGYYILNYYNYHTFDERLGKWTVKYVKVWFLDRFFFHSVDMIVHDNAIHIHITLMDNRVRVFLSIFFSLLHDV